MHTGTNPRLLAGLRAGGLVNHGGTWMEGQTFVFHVRLLGWWLSMAAGQYHHKLGSYVTKAFITLHYIYYLLVF